MRARRLGLTFLHPILAAAGLGAVAIPVVIHLLMRRRRRPVAWAAMRFLVEAYRAQKRRLLVEQWLLLATRCLLIALVALGIGRLVLGDPGATGRSGPRTVYLVIDDSLTAGVQLGAGETELDRHKARARALLESLDPSRGDRAGLIAASGLARGLIVPASSDLAAVGLAIDGLTGTDARADWPGSLSLVPEQTEPGQAGGAVETVLVSGWRAGSLEPDRALPRIDHPGLVWAVRSTGASGSDAGSTWNVAVETVEPIRRLIVSDAVLGDGAGGSQEASPGAASPILIRLERSGDAAMVARRGIVVLEAFEPRGAWVEIGEREFEFAPGARASELVVPTSLSGLSLRGSWIVVRASIEGSGGAIAGDDHAQSVVRVRRGVRVGVVARRSLGGGVGVAGFGPGDWIEAALSPSPGSGVEVVRLDPGGLSTSRIATLDALVVASPDLLQESAWELIGAFARGRIGNRGGQAGDEPGGSGRLVVVMPSTDQANQSWARPLREHLGVDVEVDSVPTRSEQGAGLDGSVAGALTGQELGSASQGDREAGGFLSLLGGEFRELAQPVVVTRWLGLEPGPSVERIVALRDGTPIVVGGWSTRETGEDSGERAQQSGYVVVFGVAMDPSWTTLPLKPLAVPLLQEIVRRGIGRASGPARIPAGQAVTLDGDAALGAIVRLDAQGSSATPRRSPARIEAAPSPRGRAAVARWAGVWLAMDAEGNERGVLEIRRDPRASDTSARDRVELLDQLAEAVQEVRWIEPSGEDDRPGVDSLTGSSGSLGSDASGSDGGLAGWLFAAALAVALGETVLARRLSR